ncbi:bacteriocin immunity protein [Ruminococcus sp. HUN007]|uniref:bacteriocin immunity protein n=1 Tax=Ruminococcus sp. HUN007 TaxID=1514668 RepID=UPI0005D1F1C7|nr:bacteriocin immunity protein [Ruminococcus sp. HUN007]
MSDKLSREELIKLVSDIIECNGTEKEIDEMMEVVEKNVPDPNVSDLIFWNDDNLTPEQIIDKAFEYKPIQL